MRHFSLQSGVLHAEDVALPALAEHVGTPFYCYSTATLKRHYHVFYEALQALNPLICYAVKANSNLAVLKTLADLGAGADVVSIGELKRAIAAGVPPFRIIFSGVGKTAQDLAAALQAGIYQINVESAPELLALNEIACRMQIKAPVALRINPDIDAGTHAKISTGKAENKFGIALDQAAALYAQAHALPGIAAQGFAVHIGSQLNSLEPLEAAFIKIGALIAQVRAQGLSVMRADLGGGLGIPYHDAAAIEGPPLPVAYGAMVARVTKDWDVALAFEPGRLIVGNAGILVTRILYIKQGQAKTFVVVDAAMNDLIRPSLYDAYHGIEPVVPRTGAQKPVTLVGPVCESGDTFAEDRLLPPLEAGDLLVFHSAGAYGAVMASTYNTRPLIPEVLVRGGDYALVRPRVEVDTLIGLDKLPQWPKL
jgi:diaminopimelate decarboxylase